MSEPIRDLESAVRELGALPVPVGFEPPMTNEQRAAIAELIGNAKPAAASLIASLAKAVSDVREHEHPKWEDLYCQNLLMWLGERMGPLLRRLLDAEVRAAELQRQRNAFRDQRNNVFATNEQLLARVEEVQAARLRAENETRTAQREAAALRARIAELEAERHVTNEVLSDSAEALRANRDRIAELEARLAEREQSAGTYPPALPWARLMDADDLEGFLADLVDAASGDDDLSTLAEVEDAIGRWRLIGEAQHAHNTAPGPNATKGGERS